MNFLLTHKREVAMLTGEHLWLVGISMLLAVAVGVPLGILLTRKPKLKTLILGSTNIIQTIPSLALFGLLLPLPWLGARADRLAIFALALYALLPIVRNTYVGITGISEPVREAAVAMGLTSRQLLWQVELPLASPVILAGIRVATVITIGVGDDRRGDRSRRAGRVHLSRHRDGGQRRDSGGRHSGRAHGPAGGFPVGWRREAPRAQAALTCSIAARLFPGLMLLAAGCRIANARHRRGLEELHRTTDPG